MVSKKIEKRYSILRTIVALGISMLIAFVIIIVVSDEPLRSIQLFVTGPLSTVKRFGNIIEKMIPLLFTGVAVSIMYSANQINMASEGAFFLGGVGAAFMAVRIALPLGIHPIVCIAAGGLLGAFVTTIPAILYVKYDAKPVVSSLMMNYIALFLGLYIINYIIRDPDAGFLASYKFAESATLPGIIPKTKIHFGLILGILVVVFGYLFLEKSKRGYEIRIIGQNPTFARYSGMPVMQTILGCQILGGFIAGMGGATEVLGMYDRFQYSALTNHGFDGVLVAVLARYNPKMVPLSAFFLAYIRTGADIMSRMTNVPVEIVSVIQAVVILLIAADRLLDHWKHKDIVKSSQRRMEESEVASA